MVFANCNCNRARERGEDLRRAEGGEKGGILGVQKPGFRDAGTGHATPR